MSIKSGDTHLPYTFNNFEEAVMTITSRPYRDEHDLEQMRRFLMNAQASERSTGYLHVGDLVWRIWDTLIAYDPQHVVHLWEGGDKNVIGFALFYPVYGGFNLQVHPLYRGGHVEEDMLAWAEQCLRALMQQEGQNGAIDAWDVFEMDTDRIALLERRGFARRPDVWFVATRSLDEPIPTPVVPEGFTIRSIVGADDVAERIAHRSDVTTERYLQFMHAPGYDRTLDLVAVAPDGRFGAYCICWMDAVNRVGEFEPVGTRPHFRRQGLARAIVLEGFRRLKAMGAMTALVCYQGDNVAARDLYASVGFRTYAKIYTYTKEL
jgi:ribosomal protein S18 acetylase RimI-like enzyme